MCQYFTMVSGLYAPTHGRHGQPISWRAVAVLCHPARRQEAFDHQDHEPREFT
jgi:hypothetical protein